MLSPFFFIYVHRYQPEKLVAIGTMIMTRMDTKISMVGIISLEFAFSESRLAKLRRSDHISFAQELADLRIALRHVLHNGGGQLRRLLRVAAVDKRAVGHLRRDGVVHLLGDLLHLQI